MSKPKLLSESFSIYLHKTMAKDLHTLSRALRTDMSSLIRYFIEVGLQSSRVKKILAGASREEARKLVKDVIKIDCKTGRIFSRDSKIRFEIIASSSGSSTMPKVPSEDDLRQILFPKRTNLKKSPSADEG